ncbi:hypothetical protein NPIL_7871 [Nephila pilipes]|uniref:Uncharacterized protein n=1 Tax=Nephila pilipes TaxID=299642 RepID=A0A8X6TA05_NEPPI|nr:hypothetical protein NPIL_7871 [Nephila pilipes]
MYTYSSICGSRPNAYCAKCRRVPNGTWLTVKSTENCSAAFSKKSLLAVAYLAKSPDAAARRYQPFQYRVSLRVCCYRLAKISRKAASGSICRATPFHQFQDGSFLAFCYRTLNHLKEENKRGWRSGVIKRMRSSNFYGTEATAVACLYVPGATRISASYAQASAA